MQQIKPQAMSANHGPDQYPSTVHVKVMGWNNPDFESEVFDIVKKHVPKLEKSQLSTRPSKGNKYISITITFVANDKQQMDDLYRELSAHPKVLMAL